ncbi:MAG: hypothetical protein RLZZ524_467 [Pseudomonadota bacterium]|jgi:hypothetical protein
MHAPWIQPFLARLAETGVVSRACRAAGVSRTMVDRQRKTDADFAAAWEEAMEEATDAAEAELRRRAIDGVDELVVYQGAPTYLHERDAQGNVIQEAHATTVVQPDGTTKQVWEMRPKLKLDERGMPVLLTTRKYSDALLALLVKGRRKAVFAERTELTGADGKDLEMADPTARAARVAALVRLAQQRAAGAAINPEDYV